MHILNAIIKLLEFLKLISHNRESYKQKERKSRIVKKFQNLVLNKIYVLMY